MKYNLFLLFAVIISSLYSQEILKYQFEELELYVTKNNYGASSSIVSIEIWRYGSYIQNIVPDKNNFYSSINNEAIIICEDMNFDGYKDIRIHKEMPFEIDFQFLYWLYNPEKEKFEKNVSYEELYSPKFDLKKKEITSIWWGDLDDENIYRYKVIDNEPFLIEKYFEEYIKPKVKKAELWKLINGELKLVEKKIIK